MADRFNDYDESTPICADWLNAVDRSVAGGLGWAETPEEARAWLEAVEEAPGDGSPYVRQDAAWAPLSGATVVHNDLQGRSTADAHPQAAITGLETALQGLAFDITSVEAALAAEPWVLDAGQDVLEIFVSPTGSATPANPLAGDPFDHPASALGWLQRYNGSIGLQVRLTVAAGFYSIINPSMWDVPAGLSVDVRGAAPVGSLPTGVAGCSWATDPLAPTPAARGANELYNTAGQLAYNATTPTRDAARATDRTNNLALCVGTWDGSRYTGGRWQTVFGVAPSDPHTGGGLALGGGPVKREGYIRFENVAFVGTTTMTGAVVGVNAAAHAVFVSCLFTGGAYGILVTRGASARLTGCTVFGSTYGAAGSNGGTLELTGTNIVQGCSTGLRTSFMGSVTGTGVLIVSGCVTAIAVLYASALALTLGAGSLVTGCSTGSQVANSSRAYLAALPCAAGLNFVFILTASTLEAVVDLLEGCGAPVVAYTSVGKLAFNTIVKGLGASEALQSSTLSMTASSAPTNWECNTAAAKLRALAGSAIYTALGAMTHSGATTLVQATQGATIVIGNTAGLTFSPAYNTVGNANSIITP